MVEPVRFLTEGFLLGVATGHLCLATCGPVYAPFLMQNNLSNLRYFINLLQLSLGRFITYISIGALAGLFGHRVSELQREYFTFSAYILFSIFLVISSFRSRKCEKGCTVSKWNRFSEWPIILGLLSGINVCPSFLIAFTRSFNLSGPVSGAFFFMAFFVGTNLFLLPVLFIGMLGKQRLFRQIARICAIGVAVWFIFNAIQISYALIKPHFDDRPVISLMDEKPLFILFNDKSDADNAARIIAGKRKGPVHIVSTKDNLPQNCYVLTKQSGQFSESDLRAPGRFVAVIADSSLSDSSGIESVTTFLEKFHFRFNTEKGDVFYLR